MGPWFKLANAEKIYPPTQTRSWSAMFRLSVTLTEEVDAAVLAQAQDNVLRRFPSFSCRLRKGLFWYYFERIDGAPPVSEDIFSPLRNINPRRNRHFLYRILYRRNRIALEFFHVLTDGAGGVTFLTSLTNEYLRLKHGVGVVRSKYILDCADEPSAEEYEDSFLRYARAETIGRGEKPAYHFPGTPTKQNKLLIISGRVPTDVLRAKAEEHGASLGVFLAAMLLYAVYQRQREEKSSAKRKQDVKISVPVNLRAFFPSKTLRNFSSYVNPGICSRLGEFTFREVLEQVNHFMGMHVNEKELGARFSANVATEKNWFIRILPLFLKTPLMKAAWYVQGDRYISSTITNLGVLKLPGELESYIQRVDAILGRPADRRCTCACVSCAGSTVFNFSRSMRETDVERNFFTALVKMGVPVFIESNGRG